MKNFLLINPTYTVSHPPLGLGYLASYLEAHYPGRYRFHLVDYAWQTDADLEEALGRWQPDLIGLTATTNTFLEAQRIARFIKARHSAPLILGGVHITAVPEDLLNSPFDLAVLGEGEETLREVACHFDQTGTLQNEHISGLAFQAGDRLVQTPPRPLIADLDQIPMPDYSLFNMRGHYTRPRALAHGFYAKGASMMPSRGCPYGDCSFCGSSLMWRRRVRFFSPKRVFQEINHLMSAYGLNSIIFLDDNFTTNKSWLEELAGYIKAADFFPYFKFDCESIAEFIDNEKARLLKAMGCERIEFGFESGCQRVLSELKNGRATLAKTSAAIEVCRRHGLKILGNFIFGWPDETPEEILETYDFIQKHPMDYVAWHTLAPYPGTRAWRIFEEKLAENGRPFLRQDFYTAETCNSHFHLNPFLDPAQGQDIYEKMRRQAYLSNTQVVHELNLSKEEREELWMAFRKDMDRLNLKKPAISRTKPVRSTTAARALPQVSQPASDSLASLCTRLEKRLPLATPDIMAEFELLDGHPWERHTQSADATYYACLHALAQAGRPHRILEIGSGFGLSAAAFLKASKDLDLFVSLDLGIFGEQYGFPEGNLAFARRKIEAWCERQGVPRERVRFFQANTQPPGLSDNDNVACLAPLWREVPELIKLLAPESFDLLFVDGKHTDDGLYNDLATFWQFLKPGGILLCDDLHNESYRDIFAWAGDTLASFQRFAAEQAADIDQTYIWPFPRVHPPGREGLRPFGIIRKKEAKPASVEPPVRVEATGEAKDLPVFARLIEDLARGQQRLYYRDQSPQSLGDLVKMAEDFQPTRIIELGTLSGLSLRAWLAAGTEARLTAVDLSFAALQQSLSVAPVDLSRVRLLEQDILKTDFAGLWRPEDKVLLYIDAHDQPGCLIMEHILNNALPLLPPGSLVVVDDLWHSPETLSPGNVSEFFADEILQEIDPLQCFTGHYAPYWQGGSFLGFAEAVPFLAWVNARKIPLNFSPAHKFVSFAWPGGQSNTGAAAQENKDYGPTGNYKYHPIADLALLTSGDINIDAPTLTALYIHHEAMELYALGNVSQALARLEEAASLPHRLSGLAYAQAVCLARLGRLPEALEPLKRELSLSFPHGQAQALLGDIRAWLDGQISEKQTPPGVRADRPALTIFACPKAFHGHTGVIQRNALASWTSLTPRPEIILFGNDAGTAEAARQLGLQHIPDVRTSKSGTPLVRDLFQQAQNLTSSPLLAYVNADIILGPDFMDAASLLGNNFPRFLMIGRRWDVDLRDTVDFARTDWWEKISSLAAASGTQHAESALDYFVFTRDLWPEIPDFALGRTAWDNWLSAHPLLEGAPVIDTTSYVTVIHQNHNYCHIQGGKAAVWQGEESSRNQDLAWASPFLAYATHATWELTKTGQVREREIQAAFMALGREGWALLQDNRPDQALEKFDKMITLFPQGIPGLQYLRALALVELGRQGEAHVALIRELADHPTHRRAQELLTSLNDEKSLERFAVPQISVVIPTHNRAAYLPQAIESVLSQGYDDLEIVVVDDGSTDDTPAVMSRFANDLRIRYVRKAKTGAPDTRNFGIRQARGGWILWLDSDDLLMPGWLARLDAALLENPQADVYYGNLVVTDASGQPAKNLRYEDFAGQNLRLLSALLRANPLPLPGSLIRRTLLQEAGGFDTAFPRAHDYELWTRLAPVARFRHVNFMAVKWRWHDGNMSSGSVARDLSYDSEIVKRLLKRHPLKEFFPDLDWENWPQAQTQAVHEIAAIFQRYGDEEAAQGWLAESAALTKKCAPPLDCAVHG